MFESFIIFEGSKASLVSSIPKAINHQLITFGGEG